MSSQSWGDDDRDNVVFYTGLIDRYGVDPRALDWGSRESQRLRFEALAGVGRFDGARVLDIGCGLGDFYGWLRERGVAVDYTGVDITPKMIDVARQRFPEARFEVLNVFAKEAISLEPPSYVVSSGIFAHRKHRPTEFFQEAIRRMFELCTEAAAFNSLSAWAPNPERGEFYADPGETLAFCRSLTPRVVLRHDYHARDFTVYLYRFRDLTLSLSKEVGG